MHQNDIGIGALESFDRSSSTVRRAVIHNPKDSLSLTVGLLLHDLLDQTAKGFDPGGALTATKDFGSPNVPSRQIGQGTAALILKFHAHGLLRLRRQGGM